MRLVATSDTHYPVNEMPIPDGDVFVHAGDLMRTGYPDDWYRCIEWLAALPHKLKYFVPGNHDFHLQVYPGPALQELRNIGVVCLGLPGNRNYESVLLPNKMRMLGLPYVTDLPRWAFNIDRDALKEVLDGYYGQFTPDIIVSHAPPKFTLDKVPVKNAHGDIGIGYAGIDVYTDYIRAVDPKHWIHGHIHEDYGTMMKGQTNIYNVAMCNRDYVHANPPLVLDL